MINFILSTKAGKLGKVKKKVFLKLCLASLAFGAILSSFLLIHKKFLTDKKNDSATFETKKNILQNKGWAVNETYLSSK
jgi:hypothetical protein